MPTSLPPRRMARRDGGLLFGLAWAAGLALAALAWFATGGLARMPDLLLMP